MIQEEVGLVEKEGDGISLCKTPVIIGFNAGSCSYENRVSLKRGGGLEHQGEIVTYLLPTATGQEGDAR
jgi:hypothetical protein